MTDLISHQKDCHFFAIALISPFASLFWIHLAPVADPGFSRRGRGATSEDGVKTLLFDKIFTENCSLNLSFLNST